MIRIPGFGNGATAEFAGSAAGEERPSSSSTPLQGAGAAASTPTGGNQQTRTGSLPARRCEGGIALALGGGAAKGWAHIGTLRAFDEEGIAISMIAGTSIGALVGGCYLAGRLDELEDFARSLTRARLVRYMDFSLSGAGIIGGAKLAAYMEMYLGGMNIEDLHTPFVSVCTDIRTGHEIWLHDGPLIEALRASYALPGIFSPIVHGGRHLVDGALVNPVPVSVCRAYEPDVVIAIDLNHETFGRGAVIRASHYTRQEANEDPIAKADTAPVNGAQSVASWLPFLSSAARTQAKSAPRRPPPRTFSQPKVQPKTRLGTMGVMMEAFNIIQDRISRARMAGDPPDFTIRPRLASIGLADFHKADESIALGYREAKSRIRELAEQGQIERT